jgi:hypothetical protein
MNIPEFPLSGTGESPAGKITPERMARAKKLSSDQIFLGVISAPRPLHMITMPAKMEHILAPFYRRLSLNRTEYSQGDSMRMGWTLELGGLHPMLVFVHQASGQMKIVSGTSPITGNGHDLCWWS